jgi:hypothetical protein
MVKTVLIAIGAGAATALLFGSLLTGTPLAFSLFLLTPVPIAIAGIGWGTVSGALAALIASAAVTVVAAPIAAAVLLILFAGPTAWLSHLVGLWREDANRPDGREWYPLGRILTHAVGLVAVGMVVVAVLLGFSPEAVIEQTTQAIHELLVASSGPESAPTAAELEPLVRLNVGAMPYTLAALNLLMLVVALWLAGRVNRASGRLARPWQPLWSVSVPALVAGLFAGSLALSFLPAPVGLVAAPFAGASGCAMLLVGLAVLHTLTRGNGGRFALLAASYVATALLVLPGFLLALVGMAESTVGIRNRLPGRPKV